MKKENIKKVGVAVLLLTILLLAGGITYAFFSSGVTGEQEKLTVTTGTLAITFSDNNTGITASTLNIGESTTKEFKIENTGTLDVTTNLLWENLINTFTSNSFTYTFQYKTSESSDWITTPLASGNVPQSLTAGDYNLATDITVPAGATYYYKLTLTYNYLDDVNQTSDADAVLTSNFKIGDKIDPALTTLAALGKTGKSGTPTFANTATTDETSSGLYFLADDYGTSYYYRGAVTDNYVKFAGFYWRIIRVNGDGSLRMIYDGTVAHNNGGGASTFTTTGVDGSTASSNRFALTSIAWNSTNYNDAKYVGYMYGGANGTASTSLSGAQTNETDTNIKTKLESWYSSNLTSYDDYIADVVYCNDRSLGNSDSTYTNLGYGTNLTSYAARMRFYSSATGYVDATPTFQCTQANDMFTKEVQTVNGKSTNGKLSQKVGLITADEIVAAGSGKYDTTNRYYYLYKSSNDWYWSLSPYSFYGNTASVLRVGMSGQLNYNSYVTNSGAVAPVISLKPEYAAELSGSGTADDPFYIPNVA